MFFGDPIYDSRKNIDPDILKNFEIINQTYGQQLERPVNDYIDQRIDTLRYKISKLT